MWEERDRENLLTKAYVKLEMKNLTIAEKNEKFFKKRLDIL